MGLSLHSFRLMYKAVQNELRNLRNPNVQSNLDSLALYEDIDNCAQEYLNLIYSERVPRRDLLVNAQRFKDVLFGVYDREHNPNVVQSQ